MKPSQTYTQFKGRLSERRRGQSDRTRQLIDGRFHMGRLDRLGAANGGLDLGGAGQKT